MAKKVTGQVKLQIPAGKATPAPPVGTALGPQGVNIMEFCKAFNAKTSAKDQEGLIIPVVITIYSDRSFTFITKTPPVAILVKRAVNLAKGSAEPNKTKVGKITLEAGRRDRQAEDAGPELLHRRSRHGPGEGRLPQHGRRRRLTFLSRDRQGAVAFQQHLISKEAGQRLVRWPAFLLRDEQVSNAMGTEGEQKVFVVLVHRAPFPNLSVHTRSESFLQPHPSVHARVGFASTEIHRPSFHRNLHIYGWSSPCANLYHVLAFRSNRDAGTRKDAEPPGGSRSPHLQHPRRSSGFQKRQRSKNH